MPRPESLPSTATLAEVITQVNNLVEYLNVLERPAYATYAVPVTTPHYLMFDAEVHFRLQITDSTTGTVTLSPDGENDEGLTITVFIKNEDTVARTVDWAAGYTSIPSRTLQAGESAYIEYVNNGTSIDVLTDKTYATVVV